MLQGLRKQLSLILLVFKTTHDRSPSHPEKSFLSLNCGKSQFMRHLSSLTSSFPRSYLDVTTYPYSILKHLGAGDIHPGPNKVL